jgi:hypothetical protein
MQKKIGAQKPCGVQRKKSNATVEFLQKKGEEKEKTFRYKFKVKTNKFNSSQNTDIRMFIKSLHLIFIRSKKLLERRREKRDRCE